MPDEHHKNHSELKTNLQLLFDARKNIFNLMLTNEHVDHHLIVGKLLEIIKQKRGNLKTASARKTILDTVITKLSSGNDQENLPELLASSGIMLHEIKIMIPENPAIKKTAIWIDISDILKNAITIRNNLAEKYYHLIRFTAQKKINILQPDTEIISAGYVGLLEGIEKFSPKAISLQDFDIKAWVPYICVWIKKRIIEEINTKAAIGGIMPQRNGEDWLYKTNKIINEYIKHEGDLPDISFLVKTTRLPEKTVIKALNIYTTKKIISLDNYYCDETRELYNIIPSNISVENGIAKKELLDMLHNLINMLPENEKQIINLMLEGKTRKEIEDSLNLSAGKLKGMRHNAIRHLQNISPPDIFILLLISLALTYTPFK